MNRTVLRTREVLENIFVMNKQQNFATKLFLGPIPRSYYMHSQPNLLNIVIVKITYKCQSINEFPRYKKFKIYTKLSKCFVISQTYFSVQCNKCRGVFCLSRNYETCLQINKVKLKCSVTGSTFLSYNIIIKYWYEQFLNPIVYTVDWKINFHFENIRVLWPMLQEPIVVPFLNYWFHLVTDGKHVQCHCLLWSCRRNGRICLPFLEPFLWYLSALLPETKMS